MMLGSQCSPCCGHANNLCLRFTGSGFTIPTLWQIRSTTNTDEGIVELDSRIANNAWHLPINSSDVVLDGSRRLLPPSVQWRGNMVGPYSDYYGGQLNNGAYVAWFFLYSYHYDASAGANSAAHVELSLRCTGTTQSIVFRKNYTFSTLPDIESDTITFTAADAISVPAGCVAGSVVVSKLQPTNVPLAKSVFDSAQEVHVSISARGGVSNYTFTRTLADPEEINWCAFGLQCAPVGFFGFGFLQLGKSIFLYSGGPFGDSYIVITEPSCGGVDRLGVAFLTNGLTLPNNPQSPPSGEATSLSAIRDPNPQDGGGAPAFSYWNPLIDAATGSTPFPAFPMVLWSGPATFWRNNFGQIVSGSPAVTLAIDGVS